MRYLILWQTKSGVVTPLEGELPTTFTEAYALASETCDALHLVEVRIVETGEDVTAQFQQEPAPSSESRADLWISQRKEETALVSPSGVAA